MDPNKKLENIIVIEVDPRKAWKEEKKLEKLEKDIKNGTRGIYSLIHIIKSIEKELNELKTQETNEEGGNPEEAEKFIEDANKLLVSMQDEYKSLFADQKAGEEEKLFQDKNNENILLTNELNKIKEEFAETKYFLQEANKKITELEKLTPNDVVQLQQNMNSLQETIGKELPNHWKNNSSYFFSILTVIGVIYLTIRENYHKCETEKNLTELQEKLKHLKKTSR